MKVPRDPDKPTMGDTFKVSAWQFLFHRRHLREEYMRRRRQAVLNDGAARQAKIAEWGERKQAESQAKKDARRNPQA